ncbi:MAG: hypothetical protein EBU90_29825 [Proteobacteria bacterium]|nr:hypothetical protein [Pseudomonadota bacterium]NBP16794.1 hypothetical protein [bacterium]
MEIKGDNIYVNIKELPVLEQVVPGNLLIIETDTGTNILDFENFIITPSNTTFYGEVLTNSTNISNLSVQEANDYQLLSTTINSVSTDLATTINDVSASLNQTIYSAISDTFTGAKQIGPAVWGQVVGATGAAYASGGIQSITRTTTTSPAVIYTIQFSGILQTDSNYIINVTPLSGGHTNPAYMIYNRNTTGFIVSSNRNLDFDFIVFK